jgi:hypothetical protein
LQRHRNRLLCPPTGADHLVDEVEAIDAFI